MRWMVVLLLGGVHVFNPHWPLHSHSHLSLTSELLKPGGSNRSSGNSDAHSSGSSSITRNELERLWETPNIEPPLWRADRCMRYSDGLPSLFLEKICLIYLIQIL